MAQRKRHSGETSKEGQAEGHPKAIYLHMDGIKQTLPFRLDDYGDAGALTEDQIAILADRCDLDTSLARDLSVLLGYALDVDSEVGLVRVKPVTPRKKAAMAQGAFRATVTGDDGMEVAVEPHDKRQVSDSRRLTVIESCCYVWLDAGRRLTITTRPDKLSAQQREGPLVTLVQTVIGMLTTPSGPMKGETLRRDIELVKLRFQMRGDLPAD